MLREVKANDHNNHQNNKIITIIMLLDDDYTAIDIKINCLLNRRHESVFDFKQKKYF